MNPHILITGDNGESLPPPYGGIMKRCLLHAKEWRQYGSDVSIHVHHKHDHESDLGAGAFYFYDYQRKPNIFDKVFFVAIHFLSNPFLFSHLFALEMKLGPHFESSYFYWAAKGVRLEKQIRKSRPDIIVSETGGFPSLVALEVAKRSGIPSILENYAEIQYKAGPNEQNIAETYASLWTYITNTASMVIAASRHCAKGPLKYVKDASHVKILYSGINFKVFNSRIESDKKVTRAKFGLPDNRFIVMAVGSLKMRKGHDQLFEALALLPEEKRKRVFVILCGMGDKEALALRAAEMGFGENGLKIFGGLSEEDLAELYSSADAFCFPSVTPRECMGMAMKEAMAIGLPVAAYDAGGISEAVEDGVNGFLAPVGSRTALAQKIAQLMDLSSEERGMMARKNVIKAKTLFDIKTTAKEMYDEIIKIVSTRNIQQSKKT